eukprot:COSAG04_NODE_4529_length_2032_cov_3.078634_2_plen_200_part_00
MLWVLGGGPPGEWRRQKIAGTPSQRGLARFGAGTQNCAPAHAQTPCRMRLLGAGRAAEGAGSAADDEGLLLLAIDDHAFPFTTGLSLSSAVGLKTCTWLGLDADQPACDAPLMDSFDEPSRANLLSPPPSTAAGGASTNQRTPAETPVGRGQLALLLSWHPQPHARMLTVRCRAGATWLRSGLRCTGTVGQSSRATCTR